MQNKVSSAWSCLKRAIATVSFSWFTAILSSDMPASSLVTQI